MIKWRYEAERNPAKPGGIDVRVVIDNDGKVTSKKLIHVIRHSPTGMQFGYGGSGPADLALSILVHYFLSFKFEYQPAIKEADKYYGQFKRDFVSIPQEKLCITNRQIEDWLNGGDGLSTPEEDELRWEQG